MFVFCILDTLDMSLNAVLQRHAGRKGTDIVGIARIPLSRIPIHDDAALAALAEQQAVSPHSLQLHTGSTLQLFSQCRLVAGSLHIMLATHNCCTAGRNYQ